MKLVAVVSSSMSMRLDPTSKASMILAAWLVLPEASSVLNPFVSLPTQRDSLAEDLRYELSFPSQHTSQATISRKSAKDTVHWLIRIALKIGLPIQRACCPPDANFSFQTSAVQSTARQSTKTLMVHEAKVLANPQQSTTRTPLHAFGAFMPLQAGLYADKQPVLS